MVVLYRLRWGVVALLVCLTVLISPVTHAHAQGLEPIEPGNPWGFGIFPTPQMVVLAGTFQSELGCADDWQPDCTATELMYNPTTGLWEGRFAIPIGEHMYKVALDGSWDRSVGSFTGRPSPNNEGYNIQMNVWQTGEIDFLYDHGTGNVFRNHVAGADDLTQVVIYSDFQQELGCEDDWQVNCEATALTFNSETQFWEGRFMLPAGSYNYQVALEGSSRWVYGAMDLAAPYANVVRGIKQPTGINIALELSQPREIYFVFEPGGHRVLNGFVTQPTLTVNANAAEPIPEDSTSQTILGTPYELADGRSPQWYMVNTPVLNNYDFSTNPGFPEISNNNSPSLVQQNGTFRLEIPSSSRIREVFMFVNQPSEAMPVFTAPYQLNLVSNTGDCDSDACWLVIPFNVQGENASMNILRYYQSGEWTISYRDENGDETTIDSGRNTGVLPNPIHPLPQMMIFKLFQNRIILDLGGTQVIDTVWDGDINGSVGVGIGRTSADAKLLLDRFEVFGLVLPNQAEIDQSSFVSTSEGFSDSFDDDTAGWGSENEDDYRYGINADSQMELAYVERSNTSFVHQLDISPGSGDYAQAPFFSAPYVMDVDVLEVTASNDYPCARFIYDAEPQMRRYKYIEFCYGESVSAGVWDNFNQTVLATMSDLPFVSSQLRPDQPQRFTLIRSEGEVSLNIDGQRVFFVEDNDPIQGTIGIGIRDAWLFDNQDTEARGVFDNLTVVPATEDALAAADTITELGDLNYNHTLIEVNFDAVPSWLQGAEGLEVRDGQLHIEIDPVQNTPSRFDLIPRDTISTSQPFEILLDLSDVVYDPDAPFYITFAFNGQNIQVANLIGSTTQYMAYNFAISGTDNYYSAISPFNASRLQRPIQFNQEGPTNLRLVVNDGVNEQFVIQFYVDGVLATETSVEGADISRLEVEPILKTIDGEVTMIIGAAAGGRFSATIDNLVIRNFQPENYQPVPYERSDTPVYGLLESVLFGAPASSGDGTIGGDPVSADVIASDFDTLNQCRVADSDDNTSTQPLQTGSNTAVGGGGITIECNFAANAGQTVMVQCANCGTVVIQDANQQPISSEPGSVVIQQDGTYKLLLAAEFGWYAETNTRQEFAGTVCQPGYGCGDTWSEVTDTYYTPIYGNVTFDFSVTD